MTTKATKYTYLDTMGIPAWESRETVSAAESPAPFVVTPVPDAPDMPARGEEMAPEAAASAGEGIATPAEWEGLRAQVSACLACELHKTRTQTVFGTGSVNADWMLIGEAPGADEDRQGEPFVGRAGRLLNAMLEAIGLSREEVYIANILKCRPPRNRDPEPAEVLACESFLLRQIALINPRIILAVGRIAAQNLLARTTPIGQMRTRRFTFRDTGIPVVVTYHPAYFLRSPLQKRRGWEDLLFARSVYAEGKCKSRIVSHNEAP
ncbi:MAG: DNA polymerase [Candidatus Kentron sp. G]|nr:MAG: DNA polymerase [Candidatus Kentron sp. G]VFN06805.1 MAG: DNA polymerase [Candidatus Kentron sp. G]